jgi:hypothetical protein
MELNLMSTDLIYPNINVVFDDSIFDVDEDPVFTLYVNEAFNAQVTFPSYANRVRIAGTPYNYNQPITFPPHVNSLAQALFECHNFNRPVTIPSTVKTCYQMLRNCYNYDQPTVIPDGVTNAVDFFASCFSMNSPVTIPDSVDNASYCFSSCSSYNQPTVLPKNALYLVNTFRWCNQFQQPVTIPNKVLDVSNMFYGTNYNQPVTFMDGCTTANHLFEGLNMYNCEVSMADSIKYMIATFQYMPNFNKPVTLPANIISLNSAFYSVRQFNQPLIIPNGARNCEHMIDLCTMYNSVVMIPPTVINTQYMFSSINSCPYNTYNSRYGESTNAALKQPIYFFANGIFDASNMFRECNTMSTLYLLGLQNNRQLNRFMRTNGQVRCNIYTDDTCQNYLYNTYLLDNGGKPTWSNDLANGCIYNVPLNLYIYNNWDGHIPDYCRLLYRYSTNNSILFQEYIRSGENGTFEYGTNEWSDVPNGAPITNILNNITVDTNVYYVGALIDEWVRQKTGISGYAWDIYNASYTAAGNGSNPAGVVINCQDIAGVSYKAVVPSGAYIQCGRCQRTATLPTIITSGTQRIDYGSSVTNSYYLEPSQDVFLGGYNYDMQYVLTYREGAIDNNGIRLITQDTGGYSAAMQITVANNSPEVLRYQDASQGVNYGNLFTLKYPYSSSRWGAVALTNVTDGLNNYNSGELIKQWYYSDKVAFTVWPRD